MIEMVFSMMILGVVLVAFMGIFSLFQRSSAQSHQYAEAQQNARIAMDYVTEYVRQAGSGTDYVKAQRFIVQAAPFQVAFNADIDNGQTIAGDVPLASISRGHSPNRVPSSGTLIYSPPREYDSPAETLVLTLDSNTDGQVTGSDQGDDQEEAGANPNIYLLKKYTYGYDGSGANVVRTASLAMVRGPGAYQNGTHPEPLFQYFYDHDDNEGTDDVLWGDTSNDGKLTGAEISAVTVMPDTLLSRIRKVHVSVTSESDKYNSKFDATDGHLAVTMNSEVFVRNSTRSNSVIYGTVYHDFNGDGVFDQGETGLPNVKVVLVGMNKEVLTNSFGVYYLPVTSGDYAVREYDPPGYTSTTPTTVATKMVSGDAVRVDFGDAVGSAVGFIRGAVFEDLDGDGYQQPGELGIPEVLLSLDTGEEMFTNDAGLYEFVVPVGSYVVVETDPEGFSSTTSNSQDASLFVAGDTVIADFGDSSTPMSGTIEGYVFEDDDMNGVHDTGEMGISNVSLHASSGDSTVTNASGYYQFSLSPGSYSIVERDPPGYTSSTVNTFVGILVTPDTTVTRDFGDFLINRNDYIEIAIGNTERALSVAGVDFVEDNRQDIDIVLGTPFTGGVGNLQVFLNKRLNATTALGALFDSTPSYQRDTGANINTLNVYDFSGDGLHDVLTGINFNTGNNIQIWNCGAKGLLSSIPDAAYVSSSNTYVLDSKLGDLTGASGKDLVVGLRGFISYTGGFQVFKRLGGGTYTPLDRITSAGPNGEYPLGEVWAVDIADINGNGLLDVVVGSRESEFRGYIDIYYNTGNASAVVKWGARYFGLGAVNDLKLVDMMEDDAGDVDILVGSSAAAGIGWLTLWLNTDGKFGVEDSTGYAFPSGASPRWPNDANNPAGEVLAIEVANVNPDIFPEVFFGTRDSAFYTGNVYVMETFGSLPSEGRQLNSNNNIGEVVTLGISDFNSDRWADLVVGTRSSSSQGKLLIYFYDD